MENGIISENQLGFMPGNRTSDALIVLFNLVQKYCFINNTYIYACFVDFKKAFDCIPRQILFEKLLSYNITGNFYNSIKNMYTHDLACIGIGDKLTESFNVNQGVKQGCILSPLLFNIFISDLPKSLGEGDSSPVHIDENKTLNSLIWADDLLMVSETESGLNNMLKNLENYTKANLIKVNLSKTKCMIFNKTGRLIRRKFCLGHEKVEVVREYKYLGFLITTSFSMHAALTDLKDKGMRSYGAMKTKLGCLFRKHILITTHLFDSLVKPVLLYASDFWGSLKLPKYNPVENLHIKFCKELLGVQVQTTNIAVLSEIGRIPLTLYGKKNASKNWERIGIHHRANKLLLTSYQNSVENGWTSFMRNCFSSIGLLDLFLTQNLTISRSNRLFYREKDIFQQMALSEISNMPKLRTYAHIKDDINFEEYLVSVRNVHDRIALTRFRLSSHSLMIEKGRHQNMKLFDRTCPFCPQHIENELHFLIQCPTYQHLRKTLLDNVKDTIIGFYYPEDELFLFWFLLRNPVIAHLTARFIKLSMELRTFLIDGHKNPM